jgi:hypothetical protein
MNEIDGYPIQKVGSRWICDGPEGRFQAGSKRDAIALLRSTKGKYRDMGEYRQIVDAYYAKEEK